MNKSINPYSSLRPQPSLITLLTDFGMADYFVAAMKGAILYVNPQARIVDITHEIPSYDIQSAAFTLLAVYKTFPAGTIHVAVVDPGVGSMRRPLLVECGEQLFIGPDNGIFSYVCEREGSFRAFHLTDRSFFRQPVSNTFHGRDLFAPVAAALSNGVKAEALGEEIDDLVLLAPLAPKVVSEAGEEALEASIIHVDRFGNCITSLARDEIEGEMKARSVRLIINGREISSFRRFFSEDSSHHKEGELFALWGSAGFLEIAAYMDSAARILCARRGQKLLVTFEKW